MPALSQFPQSATFEASYPARRRGSFFARAYYYGVTSAARSDKQFFRVW